MDKNQRKLIEKEISAELKDMDERLMNINQFYQLVKESAPVLSQEKQIELFTKDGRWLSLLEETTFRSFEYFIKQYLVNLKRVVKAERYYTAGLLKDFTDIEDAVNMFAERTLSPLSNKLRYKQIKSIEDDGLLSEIILTALKLKTYSICDNLTDEWGDKLARYTTDNKNNIIAKLVEEEYYSKSSASNLNIVENISLQELAHLKEKIDTGERFIIYRGFAIKEKDKVRRDKKTAGDKYYMQDAGTGLSYSLRKGVATYFAYRSITGGRMTLEWKQNRYNKPTAQWYVPSDKLIETTEKMIFEEREIKQLKPIVGKYECDPKKILGYHFGVGEGEIIIKPKDLKLLHYEIPHSNTIAEEVIKFRNSDATEPNQLKCAFANGLAAFRGRTPEGDLYVYAETEKMREYLEEMIDYGEEPEREQQLDLYNKFMDNSVVIPYPMDAFTFENGLLEYMQNPKDIIRKKGTLYSKQARKIKRQKLKTGKKGFDKK